MNLKNELKNKINNYLEVVSNKAILNKEDFTLKEIEQVKKDILKDFLIEVKAKATRNVEYLKEIKIEGELNKEKNNYIYKKKSNNFFVFTTDTQEHKTNNFVNKETLDYIIRLANHYAQTTINNNKKIEVEKKDSFIIGSKISFIEDIKSRLVEGRYYTRHYKEESLSVKSKNIKTKKYNNTYSFIAKSKKKKDSKKQTEENNKQNKLNHYVKSIKHFVEMFL